MIRSATLAVAACTVAVVAYALWITFKEPVHAVSWYVDHPDERGVEFAQGKDNPRPNSANYHAAHLAEVLSRLNTEHPRTGN